MKNATAITGATGEYYVAAYLSALGHVVALPRGGVPSFDLLIVDNETNKTISLQIKTANKPLNKSKKYGDYYAWSASIKAKTIPDASHWYAFVNLNDWTNCDKNPDIFFVSAEDVKANIEDEKYNKSDATWKFYQLDFDDAENFKGRKGYEKMMASLKKVEAEMV